MSEFIGHVQIISIGHARFLLGMSNQHVRLYWTRPVKVDMSGYIGLVRRADIVVFFGKEKFIQAYKLKDAFEHVDLMIDNNISWLTQTYTKLPFK